LKDTYNQQLNDEKKQIEQYINAYYPNVPKSDYFPNNDGLYYIEQIKGTGDTVSSAADYVLINYTAKFLDGTLFDTTDTTVVLSNYIPWLEIGGPFTLSIASNFYGLVEGIRLMKEGGKATLVIPSTLSFGDFKPRVYDVTLLKVYHNIAASRKLEFDSTFMVPMRFALQDSTQGGVFMNIDSTSMVSTGVNYPKAGDTIAVKFKGKIMDFMNDTIPNGRTFAAYDSAEYIVGSSVVPVFYEALLKMKRGWKAKVYAPFYNAYGANTIYDYKNNGQILIPPYSNLMFDLEFVGFVNSTGIIDKSKN
jgi:FKBP-type peptidyl-prolyl cis-trans isomerase